MTEEVKEDSTEQANETQNAPEPLSFLDSIPEDLRAEKSLQDIKDLGALAKSYVNAQKMLGGSIRIPGEDAGNEQREDFYKKLQDVPGVVKMPEENDSDSLNRFYTKLGRPEKAEDYKIDIDESLKPDVAQLDEFKKMAFEAGLTTKQVNQLINFETNRYKTYEENIISKQKGYEDKLKSSFGKEYENKMKSAQVIVEHYAKTYPDEIQELISSEAGNNPAMINMLADMANFMAESGDIPKTKSNNYGLTPDEAKSRISEMRLNREHPYHNPKDPGHKHAVAKMQEYYAAAYPDEKK